MFRNAELARPRQIGIPIRRELDVVLRREIPATVSRVGSQATFPRKLSQAQEQERKLGLR